VAHASSVARLVLASLVTVAATGLSGQTTVKLKYASGFPTTSPYEVDGSRFWMKRVTELTNGKVQFAYYPAGQLAKPEKTLSLAASGVADVAMVAANLETDKFPLVSLVELPGAYNTACGGTTAYNTLLQPGKVVADVELKNKPYRMLFFVLQPVARISMASKTIKAPTDLLGQKVRVAGGTQALTVSKLGGAPVRMSAADAFQAISRRTVDGILLSWSSLKIYGLIPTVKSTTAGIGFGGTASGVSFNQAAWAKLSPDIQAAITKASAETSAHLCRQLENEDAVAAKMLQQRGVVMTQFSDAERAVFQKTLEPIVGEWASGLERRGLPATLALRQFTAALPATK
jgi:TRAP-type C4-dicarboxylate transport system substrate-binding protein